MTDIFSRGIKMADLIVIGLDSNRTESSILLGSDAMFPDGDFISWGNGFDGEVWGIYVPANNATVSDPADNASVTLQARWK